MNPKYASQISTDDFDELKEDMSFIFGLKEKIGALAKALKIFDVILGSQKFVETIIH